MNKKKPQYNEWIKRRSNKIWIKRLKREQIRRQMIQQNNPKKNRKKNIEELAYKLPKTLSLINNFDEVITKIKQIKKQILNNTIKKKEIFLDMSETTSITVDALMYLLTFIKNTSYNFNNLINLSGNFPNDKSCANKVKQSGFLNYLVSNAKSEKSTENLYIKSGISVDSDFFAELCDFVQSKLNLKMIDTKKLYATLGEIVGNSNEHAYENNKIWSNWLIYASYKNNLVRIVILDSGFGILETVRKKFFIDALTPDESILKSAFSGKFNRSMTKKEYRNRGLPAIVGYAKERAFKSLTLLTNNVEYKCFFNNGKMEESCKTYKESMEGTLYYIEIAGG